MRTRTFWVIAAFVISSLGATNAETTNPIRHDFAALSLAGKLGFNVGYTIGTISGTSSDQVYTCYSSGAFGIAKPSDKLCVILPTDGYVVTSSKVTGLWELKVYVERAVSGKDITPSNIEVSYSTDGSSWVGPLTDSNAGATATVNMPVGNYYIKIAYTGSNSAAITAIYYYRDDCNCQPYIAP